VFILLLGPMLGAGRQIAAGHLSWTLNSGPDIAAHDRVRPGQLVRG
jgi:hypothetical protein